MRYSSKRQYVMNHGLAYSVGLMASDGLLSKDGRHLSLTSNDIEQLVNLCNSIRRDVKISPKSSGKGQFSHMVQFSDVAYYDFLLGIGLTPAKSHTISKLKIPDEVYADFLRGLFDGDGTTYGYMDKRWKSSFMFYIGFTSASRDFLEYIQSANFRLIGVSPASIANGKRALTLTYAKADSHKIYSYMYPHDGVTCLTRKRLKLLNFTDKDRADILARLVQ